MLLCGRYEGIDQRIVDAFVTDEISVLSLAFDKDLSALSLLGRAEYSAFNQTSGMSFFAAEAGIDYLVPASRKSDLAMMLFSSRGLFRRMIPYNLLSPAFMLLGN